MHEFPEECEDNEAEKEQFQAAMDSTILRLNDIRLLPLSGLGWCFAKGIKNIMWIPTLWCRTIATDPRHFTHLRRGLPKIRRRDVVENPSKSIGTWVLLVHQPMSHG